MEMRSDYMLVSNELVAQILPAIAIHKVVTLWLKPRASAATIKLVIELAKNRNSGSREVH